MGGFVDKIVDKGKKVVTSVVTVFNGGLILMLHWVYLLLVGYFQEL